MITISLLIGLLIVMAVILIAILERPLNLNKDFYIKLSFALLLLTSLSYLMSFFIPFVLVAFAGSLSLYFILAFVILHASKALGNKKTAIFLIFAGLFGLIFETLGVKYGIFGHYYYNIPTFFFGLVPLEIPISWAIIIYICYTVSNLFLFGFGGEKPKKTDNLWYLVVLTVLISSIGGFMAANLSMITEPVSISPQVAAWVWIGGGPYFGMPLIGIAGWFIVSTFALLIFRVYEAFSTPSEEMPRLNKLLHSPFYLYIILIYLIYLIFDAVQAFKIGRPELILIGTTTMVPFILIGLLVLILNLKKDNGEIPMG